MLPHQKVPSYHRNEGCEPLYLNQPRGVIIWTADTVNTCPVYISVESSQSVLVTLGRNYDLPREVCGEELHVGYTLGDPGCISGQQQNVFTHDVKIIVDISDTLISQKIEIRYEGELINVTKRVFVYFHKC